MDSHFDQPNANSPINDPEQLLNVAQASALLAVKPKTLYAWITRNQIPYRKLNTLVRFNRSELVEWSKKRMVQ